MSPPASIPPTPLRAHDALAEAGRKRLATRLPRPDATSVAVSAALLAAVVTVIVAALLLRSILIFGGFGLS
ncbi:MAG TPA: hypothetical protein VFI22_07130 [Thermomicrobiales bacterium]|nr:hypothetical protein [Thermomicrobiales bacterium]